MNRITQKMEEGVASGVFPGGVLLVEYNGEVVFHEAFGSAALFPERIPATRETLFDLASLTKPLATASALLLLFQRQLIALEDPVSKFLSEYTEGAKKGVTLFHLLNHSSGLPDWAPFYRSIVKQEEKEPGFIGSPSAKEKVYQLACREPLAHPPGFKALYSDIGFMILGRIVEKVGGESLQSFCSSNLFSKIGCKESIFIRPGEPPEQIGTRRFAATEDCPWRGRIIQGAVHDDNAYVMGGVAGHAGLFSTAQEVHRMVRHWLDSLQGDGLFEPSPALRFVTRQTGRTVPTGSSWGLGWDTPSRPDSSSGRFFSSSSFGHLGFTGTSIWVDRQNQLAVILLTNRIHPSRENHLIRLFRPALHDLVFQETAGG